MKNINKENDNELGNAISMPSVDAFTSLVTPTVTWAERTWPTYLKRLNLCHFSYVPCNNPTTFTEICAILGSLLIVSKILIMFESE